MIAKIIRSILKKNKKYHNTFEAMMLEQDQHGINLEFVSANAVRVIQTLQNAGYKAFIVGGAVRDLLLSLKPKDFDVATNATPEQIKKLFRRAFIIGRRFQIVHVIFGQELIEVTTFRSNSSNISFKDECGRVLRDNTFGKQHEDATRRDFTINAMYYDPLSQRVVDYHGGIFDLHAGILRIIGIPEVRYREDPVRMLRVVRFSAKLNFSIDTATSAPIPMMASLINNIPPARAFDEILKLLMSGHALACLQQLRQQELHHNLLPLLDIILQQPLSKKFITLALTDTDIRVKQGKLISAGFLFAVLLWHQVLEKWQFYQANGKYPIPALYLAADDILNTQTKKLALQRKVTSNIRDIWTMQPRFERRTGKSPYKLLEHLRLRAGFDFLSLRCASGEVESELCEWWTTFIYADHLERKILLSYKKIRTIFLIKKRQDYIYNKKITINEKREVKNT